MRIGFLAGNKIHDFMYGRTAEEVTPDALWHLELPPALAAMILWRVAKWEVTFDMNWNIPDVTVGGDHTIGTSFSKTIVTEARLLRNRPVFTQQGLGVPGKREEARVLFHKGMIYHDINIHPGNIPATTPEDDYMFGGWYLDHSQPGDNLWRILPGEAHFSLVRTNVATGTTNAVVKEWADGERMYREYQNDCGIQQPALHDSRILTPPEENDEFTDVSGFIPSPGNRGLRIKGDFSWATVSNDRENPYYAARQTIWFVIPSSSGDPLIPNYDFAEVNKFSLFDRVGYPPWGIESPRSMWKTGVVMPIGGVLLRTEKQRASGTFPFVVPTYRYVVQFSTNKFFPGAPPPYDPVGGSLVFNIDPDPVEVPLYIKFEETAVSTTDHFDTATGSTTITLEPVEWFEYSRKKLDGTTGPLYDKDTGILQTD
jgi:hypothetical protein